MSNYNYEDIKKIDTSMFITTHYLYYIEWE